MLATSYVTFKFNSLFSQSFLDNTFKDSSNFVGEHEEFLIGNFNFKIKALLEIETFSIKFIFFT